MFTFVRNTVLDPFAGKGTTLPAAAKHGRNSIGVEIDPIYCQLARKRLESGLDSLFGEAQFSFHFRPTELRAATA